jgi:flagellar biosynthesis/type III secretory pathway M-ring protein FliF/YscJ
MKDKIVKAIAIAVVTMVSGALITYLKDPKNREVVKKYAKKTQNKVRKQAKILLVKIS